MGLLDRLKAAARTSRAIQLAHEELEARDVKLGGTLHVPLSAEAALGLAMLMDSIRHSNPITRRQDGFVKIPFEQWTAIIACHNAMLEEGATPAMPIQWEPDPKVSVEDVDAVYDSDAFMSAWWRVTEEGADPHRQARIVMEELITEGYEGPIDLDDVFAVLDAAQKDVHQREA